MLTPIEIQTKSFKSGGLGYDKREVDQFMREVLSSYEILYRENMELKDKISTLTQGIQYYKTIEKTLQKALILAEKTAEDTKTAALKNAKNIENEALTKSQLVVADARNELKHIRSQTLLLLQQYESYKAQFKSLAAAQIELLESESFSINIQQQETRMPEATLEQQELDSVVSMRSFEDAYERASASEELIGDLEPSDFDSPEETVSQEASDPNSFQFINLEEE